MEISIETLLPLVVKQVAEEMMSDNDIRSELRKEMTKRLDALFAATATAQIEAVVNASIDDALDRQYFMTDAFGQSKGAATTIRNKLNEIASGYWSQRVGSKDGKPLDSVYNSVTRAEYVMMSVCGDQFSEEMKQHSVNVTATLKDAYRKQIGELLNSMINELFRVKSLQDLGKDFNPLTQTGGPK